MSLLRIVSFIAALAACGGGAPKRVRKPGEEYLAAIRLEGANSLSHEGLLAGLALTRTRDRGRAIDDYQLSLDTQRIVGLYQQRGYFSVQVTPRVERKGDAATLIFKIVEGPRAIASVVITGLPPEVPYADARALVKLANGQPFDYDAFDDAKSPMLAMVENAGYAHAQLDAQVLADRGKARATLRYTIDPGPRVTFGAITISGVDDELIEAARNRLPIREGQQYSTKLVAEAQEAIYGIGRFASVRIDVDRTSPEATVLPVKIVLHEAKRGELRAGGGAGWDSLTYQARLRASLTYAGWPSSLTTVGAEFRPVYTVLREDCSFWEVWDCDYEPRLKLIGWIAQQDFLRRDVKADVEGGLDYIKQEAYTTTGGRARLGIGMPFAARRVEARVGWQFGYYRFTDLHELLDPAKSEAYGVSMDTARANATALGIDKPERLAAFTESISVDFRDNPVSPSLGVYSELRVTQGGAYAGGAFDYVQIVPEVRGYVPLGSAVLAAHARLGMIRGDVPPTERFFAGGANSQRGFPERHLSPMLDNYAAVRAAAMEMPPRTLEELEVPIGGAALLDASIELRTKFQLFGLDMGGVVFADAGDVTNTVGELDPASLHWAVGAGIRPFYLPIGPVRLEVARRITRTNSPLPGELWNFVLSLGEAF